MSREVVSPESDHAELTALLNACRLRSRELERINEELRRFVHLAANELQEPLRAVRGYAEILEEQLPPGTGAGVLGYLHRIRSSGDRLSMVLQDLLDYAKLSSSGMVDEEINMADLFTKVKAELEPQIRVQQARVTRGELPWIGGDPRGLTIVLKSLLSNALRFCKSQPSIEVGYRREPPHHLFWVRDDGIGIPAAYHQEVFEPFRRLHTQEEYPGVGLGLAAARSVVERHAGSIWLESEPGIGTTVFFRLPGAKSL